MDKNSSIRSRGRSLEGTIGQSSGPTTRSTEPSNFNLPGVNTSTGARNNRPVPNPRRISIAQSKNLTEPKDTKSSAPQITDEAKIFGIPRLNFMLLAEMLNALPSPGDEEFNEEIRNLAFNTIEEIRPGDVIEGMLVTQMITTHHAVMECFRVAMHVDPRSLGMSEYLNRANKLMRSFMSLVETLNRHRGKGPPQVAVEHVHVNEGGRAIVGTVNQAKPTKEQTSAPNGLTDEPSTAMRSANPERNPMPVARRKG